MSRQVFLLLHLAAAVVWVGGMVFAHFCLRPAAVAVLQPPQRLPLMAAALGRFFRLVAVAVLLILGSGVALLGPAGLHGAPPGWHAMAALGVVMAGVFGFIWRVPYRQLRAGCADAAWPQAAQALNRIRQLVTLNLVLAALVIVAAVSAR